MRRAWLRDGAPATRRWWVPEDLAAPPSTEPAAAAVGAFAREDVARVLRDL